MNHDLLKDVNEFLALLTISINSFHIRTRTFHCFQRNLLYISMSYRSLIVKLAKIGLVKTVLYLRALVAVILAQFGRNPIKKMCTKLHSVIMNFVKIRTMETIIYLGALSNFSYCFPHLFFDKDKSWIADPRQ